ncbi:MAG: enoyl-CoA hydratase/isomerase family protein [Gemmatimonadales bacterium]
MDEVRLERQGSVGRLVLARPGKRNAQTPEMWTALRKIGASLLIEPDLRVLIVEGEGEVFSAGIDLAVLLGQARGDQAFAIDVEEAQQAFSWLRETPFPTIAAVQGAALGAGFQLALACDLRILAEGTVCGLPEVDFGIFPDLGGCAWLPELIGSTKAKELIFTGERFDAATALALGVANRVVPAAELRATVDRLAESLAAKAPLALRAAKWVIDAGIHPAEGALRRSAMEVRSLLGTADFREACLAVTEKRPPVFRGR